MGVLAPSQPLTDRFVQQDHRPRHVVPTRGNVELDQLQGLLEFLEAQFSRRTTALDRRAHSRMLVLSNRNGRCCLIGEEEVHLLLPHSSSWKLPHQRPAASEERVHVMDSAQFLDQCCRRCCSWRGLPRRSSRLPWTCLLRGPPPRIARNCRRSPNSEGARSRG